MLVGNSSTKVLRKRKASQNGLNQIKTDSSSITDEKSITNREKDRDNSWSDLDESLLLNDINRASSSHDAKATHSNVGTKRQFVEKKRGPSILTPVENGAYTKPSLSWRQLEFIPLYADPSESKFCAHLYETETKAGTEFGPQRIRYKTDEFIGANTRPYTREIRTTKLSPVGNQRNAEDENRRMDNVFFHSTKSEIHFNRRRSETLRIDAGESGVDNFPVINNHADHVLLRVKRVHLDCDMQINMITLRCTDLSLSSSSESAPLLTVIVRDFWSDSIFPVNSIIRLISPVRVTDKTYEINANNGLIIAEPNTLISCTTIAGMMFCSRKTVLSDRFRGCSSSFAMLLGTIVHEIFQKCLVNMPRLLTPQYLFNEYRIHHLAEVCIELVAMGETLTRFETELKAYLVNVSRWLCRHAPKSTSPTSNAKPQHRSPIQKDSSICVDSIVDIEDNVWSPTLGVKGKIDVSFKSINASEVIPLELKTGKPHVVEHLSQVMLYSLLYSETLNAGRIVPGFLLYMKDNVVRQITPKKSELKGVLQMRNRMAPFFSRLSIDGFPKPLDNSRLCSYCEHSTSCALLHRLNATHQKDHNDASNLRDTNDNDHLFKYDEVSSEMREFLNAQIAHLNDLDVKYAERWLKYIFNEWSCAKQRAGHMEALFFQPPSVRELKGTCLADMKLESVRSVDNDKYELRFSKYNGTSLGKIPFEVGNFVVVSTAKHCAIYLHPITAFDDMSITITSNNLMINASVFDNERYSIDKYESYSHYTLLLGNLMLLLRDDKRILNLRSLLIGERKPIFGSLSKEARLAFMSIKSQLTSTCKNQGVSLMNALKVEDYMIIDAIEEIDGITTAILIIQCMLKCNKTILLTASSWTILDAVTVKLLQHVDENQVLRIAAPQHDSSTVDNDINKLVRLCVQSKMAKYDERKSVELFEATRDLLLHTKVVVSPCSRISNQSIFAIRTFDVCLVVDAQNIIEPMLIRPLMQAASFILIGNLTENLSNSNDCYNLQLMPERKSDKPPSLMRRLADRFPAIVTRLTKLPNL